MRKRIVNHHRLIKNIDRTAEKTERFFDKMFKNNKPRKVKDFTWKGTQYNPYRKEDTTGNKKMMIKLSVLVVSILLLIYMVIFSGLFNITDVHISGNSRITTAEIEEVISNTLGYKSFGFIPNSSFLIANTLDISEVLKKRFPIDEIQVEKRFPHEMNIVIKEKVSTIIYDNGVMYGLVGLDGSVVELIRAVENHEWKDIIGKVSTTTTDGVTTTVDVVVDQVHTPNTINIYGDKTKEFPIIYDKRKHEVGKGLKVLKPEEVELMIAWYNQVKNMDFGVSYFTIENNIDFYITTQDGWTIKTRFARSRAEDQIREIKLALQKIENKKNLSYIDIRYENRIYWK
ncbi:MAG TPA: FtsQ-type POTRA domain-containing protein [Candidatus Magasanikbacteria bacterium]|nr:FtsQ-type POTRA domain-containing protein [Candidatus Magasanikbacteria bacterium]